jgi:TRAP-type C4-dicarboxylate transport system substrate-binding protein
MCSLTLRAACLGVVFALQASGATARDFRFADLLPADSPSVETALHLDSVLRERTGGRLGITVGHGNTASENFIVSQLRVGVLDMARLNLSAFQSTVPATIVPSLPFLFRSTDDMQRILDGPVGDYILAAMEKEGFIGLCFYGMGARSLYSTLRPIRSADDTKGMTIHIQASTAAAEIVRGLGARPLALPFDHVDDALKAGVVDAADNSWSTFVAAGHDKVAKYFNLTEHAQMPSVLVLSRKTWNELSRVDQVALRAAANDSVPYMQSRLAAYEAATNERARKSGVEIVKDVDRKSLADALVPLYPRLLPDQRLQALVQQIQAGSEIADVPATRSP